MRSNLIKEMSDNAPGDKEGFNSYAHRMSELTGIHPSNVKSQIIRYCKSEGLERPFFSSFKDKYFHIDDNYPEGKGIGKKEIQIGEKEAVMSYEGEVSITSLDEAIEFFGVDLERWKVERYVCNSWDVSMKGPEKVPIKKTNYQVKIWLSPRTDIEAAIDFNKIIPDIRKVTIIPNIPRDVEAEFDRLVISDVHIGMEPNPGGFSLYGGIWDEKEIKRRFQEVQNMCILKQRSTEIIVDDLGDYMDGWDAMTVRKQHELPQNMDNQAAFDLGVNMKVNMIKSLLQHYDQVTMRNVCNDNHSGSFGYVVNSAVKRICELLFPGQVEVINQRKFMEHYQNGCHRFILCHGKDDKNMKTGFKPHLDPKHQEKIENYINEFRLLEKGVRIEFSKGDSHQQIFDSATSQNFHYFNYMALSPASDWVQTNFKKGHSGFTFFSFYDNPNEIDCAPLRF